MMKSILLPAAALTMTAAVCLVVADERSRSTAPGGYELAQKEAVRKESAQKQPAQPAQPAKPAPAARQTPAKVAAPPPRKRSPDEEAVVQLAAAVVTAYNAHDARGFASAFTADGEYVDEKGTV